MTTFPLQLTIGDALKDAGMATADRHADDGWKAAADDAIAALAATGAKFTAYDVAQAGVPEPDNPARWGPRFGAAARAGLIESVGYAPSRRPSVHASIAHVWRGAT